MRADAVRVLPEPGQLARMIQVAGELLVPDIAGALWWPATRTLVVSDLHLEKGSSLAGRGTLLPPYDTLATLARLDKVLDRFGPCRVIALGDSFHDLGAGARLPEGGHAALKALSVRCD